MSYTFVLRDKGTKNQGWWLKINNADDLADYFEKIDNQIMTAGFNDVIDCKEFTPISRLKSKEPHPIRKHCTNSVGYAIGMYATTHNISAMEATHQIQFQKAKNMLDLIHDGYDVYVNRNGGYCFGKKDYSDWCHQPDIVFPDFKKDQIRIEKFPGGEHFYAYIDNMQVRDGDTMKWNTYEEAYKYALDIVKGRG